MRTKRLMESRGYSIEKVQQIMNGQLRDEEFRDNCQFVIDNSHELLDAFKQIDRKLGEYL